MLAKLKSFTPEFPSLYGSHFKLAAREICAILEGGSEVGTIFSVAGTVTACAHVHTHAHTHCCRSVSLAHWCGTAPGPTAPSAPITSSYSLFKSWARVCAVVHEGHSFSFTMVK